MANSAHTVKVRARSGWRVPAEGDTPVGRQAIRQSLLRYYQARTDPTRTRQARRAARALRQARRLANG